MAEEPKTTILVADDLVGQRLVLEMLLSVEGYEVVAVEDGKEALDYLRDNTPDLAILDVKMPFVSGLEICGRMKRIHRLKDVPVVILTAYKDDATIDKVRESQADELVFKPLEGKDFRETIRQVLARSRRLAEAAAAAAAEEAAAASPRDGGPGDPEQA